MGSSVRFAVLGPLVAETEHGQLDLKGPRHRAVLARLLIARGRVVPVDRLVDDLWADPPDGAVGAIPPFVAALRRALEPDRPPRAPARLLVTTGSGYALRAEEVDAWRFEEAVTKAADLAPAAALSVVDEALGWWRGPAYAEFADQGWARAEIARLDELHLLALERRAEALLGLGRAAEAVPGLEAHTGAHPLREDAWRLLALALYRAGRQGDALAALRRARQVLADELGVDPGPALRELEAGILAQTPALTAAVPSSLVGRDAELARLTEAAGRARLALISGEAGAGKTALAEAFTASMEARGWTVAWGVNPEHEGVPAAWPWTRILGALGISVPDEPNRFQWHRAVREQLTRRGKLLLVLDDLHWAGEETLALLSALVTDPLPGPVLIVGTYRSTDVAPGLAGFLGRIARAEPVRIYLGGLRAEEAAALVRATTGREVDPGTARTIYERSGGNPFFVRELARVLDTGGALSAVPPGVRDVVRYRVAQLPAAVQAVLRQAAVIGTEIDLDLLPADAAAPTAGRGPGGFRRDLPPGEAGGVSELTAGRGPGALRRDLPPGDAGGVSELSAGRGPGRGLPPGDAAEASELTAGRGRGGFRRDLPPGEARDASELTAGRGPGALRRDLPPGDVLDALELAAERGFLVEHGAGRFRFAHALVRDTIYQDLSQSRRARLHARIGETIERLRPGDVAALAHHFLLAEAPEAVRYARAAAEDAERRFAPHEAARLWQAALDHAGAAGVSERLELIMGLVRALAVTGRLDRARQHRAEALTLAERVGDPALTARVLTAFDVPAIWTANDDPALARRIAAVTERTLEALPPGEDAVRARLLATLALELRNTAGARGPRAAREAETLARRLDDPALLAFALNARFMQSFERAGLAPERARIGRELVELAQRHELVTFEVLGHLVLMQADSALADFPAADRHAEAADRLGEKHEIPLVGVFTQWYWAMRASATGQPAEAAYRAAAVRLAGTGMSGVDSGILGFALLSDRIQRGAAAGGDLDFGAYEPWCRPVVSDDGSDIPPSPRDLLFEARTCLHALVAIRRGDRATMARLHAELLPAAGELAGAGSGLLTLGPVARYLEALARHGAV
ncbi:BTAD domain-containing putative transcriptional regulator [Amycolatopsis ruanii]|uniref:BTAD domain-containing putative transcriptional regulator n=1 Tax=Amycolatopsis ruanii TaxID=944491 RepID=UPI0019682D69|nr:BTAD domain-containing putative transcriptional regulator [Amycolatopsis ruanii]